MRVIPVNSVKENSFLAKTIYDNSGRVLLREGVKLSSNLLEKISYHGFQSIYINDEYSIVEIEDYIKPELRQKAIKSVKETFLSFNNTPQSKMTSIEDVPHDTLSSIRDRDSHLHRMSEISMEIIEELSSQKELFIDLVDIKSMDNYTYQHCVNVAVLSLIVGFQLKLTKKELTDVCMGAILHDIGKVFVPKEILLKEKNLTEAEFGIMKKHTSLGYDYMKNSSEITATARIIALQHHERIDGRGYPDARGGEYINKFAKLVSVSDVYDALTSDRPYRKAMCPGEALELILGSGDTQFDYNVVCAFSDVLIPYAVGCLVKLNTGDIAVVEENFHGFPLRPKIKLVKSGEEVDLLTKLDLVIEGIVYNA